MVSHSVDVRMQLAVNGRVFVVGQLGPDFVILDDPSDHPPSPAELRLTIDGRARTWPIDLPAGIATTERRTRITPAPGQDQRS